MAGYARILAVLAATGAACWLAPTAQADDDLRATIQQEVAAALAAEKDKARAEKEKKDEKDAKTFKVFWKEGLRFESKDKNFKLRWGGRIMLDFAGFNDADYAGAGGPDSANGVEFRRVRFYTQGEIYHHIGYKLQLEFADAGGTDKDVVFRDVYIESRNLRDCFCCGIPTLQVGHFKEPFSIEELTSSKYITFMERALPNAFAPSRNTGVMIKDVFLGEQLGYAVGFFGNSNDGGEHEWIDDGYGVTGRVFWTPWYDCCCKCRRWLIDASATVRTELDGLRFRQRPEMHLAQRVIDTNISEDAGGDPLLDDVTDFFAFNIGTAVVFGPWSFQAEYTNVSVTSENGGDPTFQGAYAYVSYWLTGECRKYKAGQFSRVKPCCDFLDRDCCCWGGWELALRWSYLDLTDSNIEGGELQDVTFGVNWHLNPNTRVMFNFVYANIDGGFIDGSESWFAIGMRFQVDF